MFTYKLSGLSTPNVSRIDTLLSGYRAKFSMIKIKKICLEYKQPNNSTCMRSFEKSPKTIYAGLTTV